MISDAQTRIAFRIVVDDLWWITGLVATLVVVSSMRDLTHVTMATRVGSIVGFVAGMYFGRSSVSINPGCLWGALIGYFAGGTLDLIAWAFLSRSNDLPIITFSTLKIAMSVGRVAIEAFVASFAITGLSQVVKQWRDQRQSSYDLVWRLMTITISVLALCFLVTR